GRGAVVVQAQPGLHAGDGAVGVDVPLLVGLAVAVPDDDRGAVAGALPASVKAIAAVHLQLLGRGQGPALARAARAVPQLDLRPIRRTRVGHVHAPAGLAADEFRAGPVGRLSPEG